MQIKLKVTGLDTAIKTIKEGLPKDNARRILGIWADYARNIVLNRVDTGKSIEGGSFRKLSKSYEEYKRKHTGAAKWFYWTGQLLGSFGILELTASRVILGFFGTRGDGSSNAEIAWKLNLERPFVGLNDQERERIMSNLLKDIKSEGLV